MISQKSMTRFEVVSFEDSPQNPAKFAKQSSKKHWQRKTYAHISKHNGQLAPPPLSFAAFQRASHSRLRVRARSQMTWRVGAGLLTSTMHCPTLFVLYISILTLPPFIVCLIGRRTLSKWNFVLLSSPPPPSLLVVAHFDFVFFGFDWILFVINFVNQSDWDTMLTLSTSSSSGVFGARDTPARGIAQWERCQKSCSSNIAYCVILSSFALTFCHDRVHFDYATQPITSNYIWVCILCICIMYSIITFWVSLLCILLLPELVFSVCLWMCVYVCARQKQQLVRDVPKQTHFQFGPW